MDKTLLRNLIIAVVVIIGIGFLYWKFDYSKNASKINEMNAEYDKLNTQVAEARRVASRMQETIEKLRVLEATLEIAKKMLPDSQNFEQIIDTLTILSERNAVKIKKLTPLPVSKGAESSTVAFDVSLYGSFNSLAQYLTELGNQSRIYKVSDISIKPTTTAEGEYSIAVSMRVTTFFKGTGTANTQKGGKK